MYTAAVPNIKMLEFLRGNGCFTKEYDVMYAAVEHEDLPCLKWLKNHGHDLGPELGKKAIYVENLVILKYLYEETGYIRYYYNAAQNDLQYACEIGHIEIFEYLYQQIPDDDQLSYGQFDKCVEAFLHSVVTRNIYEDRIYPFLKYLTQNWDLSDSWPSKSTFWIFDAIYNYKNFNTDTALKCLKLMTDNGCDWTWNMLHKISRDSEIDENDLEFIDLLKSLIELNCPITDKFIYSDCATAPVSFFRYLHTTYDLNLTEEMLIRAVLAHNKALVQYLLEHGCSWSKENLVKRIQEDDECNDCEDCKELIEWLQKKCNNND